MSNPLDGADDITLASLKKMFQGARTTPVPLDEIKAAGLSCLLQEQERVGRQLTEAEATAVLERFDAELRKRLSPLA